MYVCDVCMLCTYVMSELCVSMFGILCMCVHVMYVCYVCYVCMYVMCVGNVMKCNVYVCM